MTKDEEMSGVRFWIFNTMPLKNRSVCHDRQNANTPPSEKRSIAFLTPMVEKTKTQAQNSSLKLKKKTQALGGFSQKLKKLKKITQN